MLKKLIKFLSKISIRLLLFNILLVFLPIAFFFYMDTYEKGQLISQERAMVQQGRIIASALKNSDKIEEKSLKIIENLENRSDSRIRIIGLRGEILADSSRTKADKQLDKKTNIRDIYSQQKQIQSADSNFLYSIVRYIMDLARYILRGPQQGVSREFYSGRSILEGVEVQAALEGRYGATTRISTGGQRSITLYSAIPIFKNEHVAGVVLISQSTYRILQNLYQIRLAILRIFLISLAAAVIIGLIISRTIATPLKTLRNEALNIADKTGKIKTNFKKSKRLDEIGDLSRSLTKLTNKLKDHMDKTNAFASDISHEFKNPLASIKTATELLYEYPEDKKFINIINQEVSRLERLITGVKEISNLEAGNLGDDIKIIDPHSIIEMVISRLKLSTDKNINFIIDKNDNTEIEISPIRFSQVIENIISNAISFTPDNGSIYITIKNVKNIVEIEFIDNGPGIPKENLDKVFNRFFTYRKDNKNNSGLGLSISKSIINLYGGSIHIGNSLDKGAQVSLKLKSRV